MLWFACFALPRPISFYSVGTYHTVPFSIKIKSQPYFRMSRFACFAIFLVIFLYNKIQMIFCNSWYRILLGFLMSLPFYILGMMKTLYLDMVTVKIIFYDIMCIHTAKIENTDFSWDRAWISYELGFWALVFGV